MNALHKVAGGPPSIGKQKLRKKPKANRTIFARGAAMALAEFVMRAKSPQAIATECRKVAASISDRFPDRDPATTGTWEWMLRRVAEAIDAGTEAFSLFSMEGNTKVPYVCWSALPVVTCPGMGECGRFCYSLRAWRNPSAYGRQLWATIVLRFYRRRIIDAWRALPLNLIVRLYVDGDIDSFETLLFWFNLCGQRPDLRVYGYTKSWHLMLRWHKQGRPFPPNYMVNVSSGSRFDDDPAMRQAMLDLPAARGEFIVVKVRGEGTLWPRGFERYGSKAYHEAVYAEAKRLGIKGASCGGDCGACGNGTPWCLGINPDGTRKDSLIELPVLIGAH
jgi:hypothetical protein